MENCTVLCPYASHQGTRFLEEADTRMRHQISIAELDSLPKMWLFSRTHQLPTCATNNFEGQPFDAKVNATAIGSRKCDMGFVPAPGSVEVGFFP